MNLIGLFLCNEISCNNHTYFYVKYIKIQNEKKRKCGTLKKTISPHIAHSIRIVVGSYEENEARKYRREINNFKKYMQFSNSGRLAE